jgi:arginine decarboxylase
MIAVPGRFFVTSGKATSGISELNAFDKALVMAGISEANLVPVSSVLPKGARQVERASIERGTITFCVMARMDGEGGGKISAGLAYFARKDGAGGYVAEGHIHGSADELRKKLSARAKEMAALREIEGEQPSFAIEEIDIPKGQFGSCIAALVYLP